MRRWVFVLAALVSGCGGGSPETPSPSSTTGGADPKRSAFLTAVSLVKPGIADPREERVVSAGRNTCQQLATGVPRATVVASGVERFSVNGQQVTPAEAERLVEATERTLC